MLHVCFYPFLFCDFNPFNSGGAGKYLPVPPLQEDRSCWQLADGLFILFPGVEYRQAVKDESIGDYVK